MAFISFSYPRRMYDCVMLCAAHAVGGALYTLTFIAAAAAQMKTPELLSCTASATADSIYK